jgi:hypothetical protein
MQRRLFALDEKHGTTVQVLFEQRKLSKAELATPRARRDK